MEFGVDLLDLWRVRSPADRRTRLSLRRVQTLRHQWTATQHMTANVIDLLNAANWQRAGDEKQPAPQPIPRPGDEKRQATTDARILSKVAKFREKNMTRASTPTPDIPREELA